MRAVQHQGGEAVPTDTVCFLLDDLRLGLTARRLGIDHAHVAALAELGGRWPPILVRREDHAVVDGHHRVAAARSLGWDRLQAVVFDGTSDEAFVEAIRRNVEHGLPLSIADRKAAASRLLADHPTWSDRRVAEVCAVSPRTVGRIRSATPGSAGSDRRTGRDGRARPAHMERADRDAIAAAVKANPGASLRAVARVLGVSPETVRQVRKCIERYDHGAVGAPPATKTADIVPIVAPAARVATASDAALNSTDDGREFASWFDQTDLGVGWEAHLGAIPLSRIYEVADLARSRAREWDRFATLLENRTRRSRAM